MDRANSAPIESPSRPFLTWPIGVQIALAFLITASLFFMLGRWSHTSSLRQADVLPRREAARPGLDLNQATHAELRTIPGIGDALARRIVAHREHQGGFRNLDELRKVAGIGPKTLDRIRPYLFVSAEPSFVSDGDEDDDGAPTMSRPALAARTTVSKKAAALTQPIDVNQASQADLQKLPGIGPKLSQRILDERTRGRFKSVEDLRRVPGIGAKTLENLRPHVTIGGPS